MLWCAGLYPLPWGELEMGDAYSGPDVIFCFQQLELGMEEKKQKNKSSENIKSYWEAKGVWKTDCHTNRASWKAR